MQSFDELITAATGPGVTIKKFCGFCPAEASGDLHIPVTESETVAVPVCESCAKEALDKYENGMLD